MRKKIILLLSIWLFTYTFNAYASLSNSHKLLLLMAINSNKQINWRGIAVHISDSTHMTHAECDAWHRERGWDSCGYNYVIEPDGNVYEARGAERVGAHVKGHNEELLGICFVSVDKANAAQISAFKRIRERFPDLPLHPHREFVAKDCPRGVWDQVKNL